MIDLEEAQRIVPARVSALEAEEVPLAEALYRTPAAPIVCDIDAPPFDRAVMDGYAVRADDVAAVPVTLRVTGQIAAGAEPIAKLNPGEAIQINTGAPIPPGADAVVRVEETTALDDGRRVRIERPVPVGTFITRRATYVTAGQTVLNAGTRLTPLAIGAAAAAGASRVTVHRRPRVAVLGTGDELVGVECKPTGAQIRDSNQHLLAALIAGAHARPDRLGVAKDTREDLHAKITAAMSADALCITGGVSMGQFDFVPEVLESLGATFHIRKIAIKPGRPTSFATFPDGTPVFALPGNPAGALVAFAFLVAPALARMEGRDGAMPATVSAELYGTIKPTAERRTFLPGRAAPSARGEWIVKPLSWHGSGDSFGMATANALIDRPPHSEGVSAGRNVLIHLIDFS